MAWILNPTFLLALRLTYIGIALGGLGISVYTAWDCSRDLQARRRLHMNGELEMIGRIALRSALAVAAPLHAGFLLLGLLALGSATSSPGMATLFEHPIPRIILLEAFALLYILIQGSVVLAQVRNQLDRAYLRRMVPQTVQEP